MTRIEIPIATEKSTPHRAASNLAWASKADHIEAQFVLGPNGISAAIAGKIASPHD
jgi:hypothetical protein